MAIDWGPWEYSGGNGMRVGIEVTVTAGDGRPINHDSARVLFTAEYYTQNQFTYGDSQTLNLSGAIDGTISFTNNAGGTAVSRGTRSYMYDYSAGSYGASPGSRTFTATLSGAFNGVTPSNSVVVAIPARPFAPPADPTSPAVTWLSGDSIKFTWVNHPTVGEPYNNVVTERYIWSYDPVYRTLLTSPGTVASYTDSPAVNRKYSYRVRATNTTGYSDYAAAGPIYTTPAAPTAATRSGAAGAAQTITWTNNVGYSEYQTEVWHAANGVWDSGPLFTLASGVTSVQHIATSGTVTHKYKVRAKTSTGTALYSAFSADTTATALVTSPPNAPTGLDPTGSVVVDQTGQITLKWQYNSTDSSAQTKFQIQYRDQGSSTWTTLGVTTSSDSTYTFPANTFTAGKTIEWQVLTYGNDPTPSAWSAIATFKTSPAAAVKYPLLLDIASGRVEASSTISPGGGINGVNVADEGTVVAATSTQLNFKGAAVTATQGAAGEAVITVASSGPSVTTICTSMTRPASPATGQTIYETDTFQTLIWDGALWRPVGARAATLAPVRLATTANITRADFPAIDGVTPVTGDRVLVKDQTTQLQNGIFVAQAGTWARATDFDANAEAAVRNSSTYVKEGTLNRNKIFTLTSTVATLGTDAVNFDVVTFVDNDNTFSYPTPQGSGHMFFNINAKMLYVWDGAQWAATNGFFLCTSTTRPTYPSTGVTIYETDTRASYLYDGSAWVPLGPEIQANGAAVVNNANGLNFAGAGATVTSDTGGFAKVTIPFMPWVSVKEPPFSAKGDDATDDTAAIQAAIDATPEGGTIYFPRGKYRTLGPIYPRRGQTLRGESAPRWGYTFAPQSYIKIRSTFSGAACIHLRDREQSGSGVEMGNVRIIDLALDGSAQSGTPVDGILASGLVRDARIQNVSVRYFSGAGVHTIPYVRTDTFSYYPRGWELSHVVGDTCGNQGFSFNLLDDSILFDCLAVGNATDGFFLAGVGEDQVIGCRAVFNKAHGFHVTGGSYGSTVFSACTTDRNEFNGFMVDATGKLPMLFSGCSLRRDGRNGNLGGGTYSGFRAFGATCPLVLSGVNVMPGVDDGGAGSPSPEIGIRIGTTTTLQMTSGYVHAVTTPIQNDGGNTNLYVSSEVTLATGPETAPVITHFASAPSLGGPAGGDLAGTYPNPTIANNAVTSAKIADGTIATGDLAAQTVKDLMVNVSRDGTPVVDDATRINLNGPGFAVTNEGLGSAGVTLGTGTPSAGQYVDGGTGAWTSLPAAPTTLPPSGPAGGDLAGIYPNPTIGAGKVTSAAIADGTIQSSDIAPGVIPTVPTTLPPSGPAGGDLTGTYPNPTVAALAITDAKVAAANKDGTNATPSLRTLGTGAGQAMAGSTPLQSIPAATAAVSLNSQKIINLLDGTNPTDAVTKQQLDAVSAGLDPKASVRLATTANITRSDFPVIDGVTPATGDRILVKNQTAGLQNGIFVAQVGTWPRATDFDTNSEASPGAYMWVEQGATQADTGWVLTTDGPIVLGTTSLTFTQFSGTGMIVDGAGLLKTGNTLDVQVDNLGIEIAGDKIQLKDGGITSAKIADNSITFADLNGTVSDAIAAPKLDVWDEGNTGTVIPGITVLNFVGAGVTATSTGAQQATVNIPGVTGGSTSPPNVQTFATVGSTSWTKPANAVYVVVEVQAAGGAGGSSGAAATGAHSKGGGGGAGNYAKKTFTASALGATENVVVGGGGVPLAGTTGGTGGVSSFSANAPTQISCNGGLGGVSSASNTSSFAANGGAGGTTGTSVQDFNVPGDNGAYGWGDASLCISGAGASSQFGGGGIGRPASGLSQANAGADGRGYGSGGSGASTSAGGAAALGGNGQQGVVIVTTYF